MGPTTAVSCLPTSQKYCCLVPAEGGPAVEIAPGARHRHLRRRRRGDTAQAVCLNDKAPEPCPIQPGLAIRFLTLGEALVSFS